MNFSDTESEAAYFSCDEELIIESSYFDNENEPDDIFEDCPPFREAFPLVLSSKNLIKSASTKSDFSLKDTLPLLLSSLPNLTTAEKTIDSSIQRIKSLSSLDFFRAKPDRVGDTLQSVLKINEYSVSEDKCLSSLTIDQASIHNVDSFREDFDTDNTGSISSALQVSEYSLKQHHKCLKEIPSNLHSLFSRDSFQEDNVSNKQSEPRKLNSKDENRFRKQEKEPSAAGCGESVILSQTSFNNNVNCQSSCSVCSEQDDNSKSCSTCSPISWNINFADQKVKEIPLHLRLRLCQKCAKESEEPELDSYLPEILDVDLKISNFKVLDLRRWFCISRPQYSKSCGITSLVSVWNYLYSTIGTGNRNPITQEEALYILGYRPPFGEIKFGAFTGNVTLMRWFLKLNSHYDVHGKSYYMYKPKGRCPTKWVTNNSALNSLKQGLAGTETAFIYHCMNHYFCPIGYEDTPQNPTRAYLGAAADLGCSSSRTDFRDKDRLQLSDSIEPVETWIFIGEPSRKHPPIYCKRWTEILQDLHTESPYYYDIRRPEKGVFKKNTKKKGTNLHCIIAFHKA